MSANVWNAENVVAAQTSATVAGMFWQYLKGSDQFGSVRWLWSMSLTVERGKIVLAEFGLVGKLLPSFPAVLIGQTFTYGMAKRTDPTPDVLGWHVKPSMSGW